MLFLQDRQAQLYLEEKGRCQAHIQAGGRNLEYFAALPRAGCNTGIWDGARGNPKGKQEGWNAAYRNGAFPPQELSHVQHPRGHVLGHLGHLAGATLPLVTVSSLLLCRGDAGRAILALVRQ